MRAERSADILADASVSGLPIPLFYDGYEVKAIDAPFGGLRSRGRAALRYGYRTMKRAQPYTGFYTALRNLIRSLEEVGCRPSLNDFRGARANPTRPVGLSGFPGVYDKVRLDNPAIFGPGYVPPPAEVEARMQASNIKIMTHPSQWPCEFYREVLGDRIQPLFVGIDTKLWPDWSALPKSVDCLIYDKIRWHTDERRAEVIAPIIRMLERRGLSYHVLRYGEHHLAQYRTMLGRSRSLIFCTEHETQGLAYQEAMSAGVPVFAWDDGVLVDPREIPMAPAGLKVSAVPYFDARCGVTFTRHDIEERFETFWSALGSFRPRDYVLDTISLRHGAARYLELYTRLL